MFDGVFMTLFTPIVSCLFVKFRILSVKAVLSSFISPYLYPHIHHAYLSHLPHRPNLTRQSLRLSSSPQL